METFIKICVIIGLVLFCGFVILLNVCKDEIKREYYERNHKKDKR